MSSGLHSHCSALIDPARGEEIEIDVDTFLAAWDERGRLGLVIESESNGPAKMKGVAT